MVQAYFEDMGTIWRGVQSHARPGAVLAVDIGDSNYGGVHVPTDEILVEILEAGGSRLKERLVDAYMRVWTAKTGPRTWSSSFLPCVPLTAG